MPVCRQCGRAAEFAELTVGLCPACVMEGQPSGSFPVTRKDAATASGARVLDPLASQKIVLTTEAAPDLRVAQRLDIVTAEFAVGMGLLTDVFNAWRDVFGGRAKSYQNTLKDARKAVLQELRREAHALGADAVLGVSLDYSEISGGGKSMLFLVASGTAVRLENP